MYKISLKEEFFIMDKTLGIFLALLLLIGLLILYPWLIFWFAYLGGYFAKLFIGEQLVTGLALLGINISIEQIPLIAGTLGWIGGFFKAISFSKPKND
jgi:hypothetical protein